MGGREEGTVLLGAGAWLLLVDTRSVSVWVVLDEVGRRKGPNSANQSLARDIPYLGAAWEVPVVADLADGSIVGDDCDGKNILFKVGIPGVPGTLEEICGGAGTEATEPERHCEDVGLRDGANDPTLDSENGHLILLRMTRVE